MMNIGKPTPEEFSEYHHSFISCVPTGMVEKLLMKQIDDFPAFVQKIPPEQVERIHAPYSWTVHQVIEHIVDAERVFGYRSLRFSTGDKTELPGWNENEYADQPYGNGATITDLAQEFTALRTANVCLLSRLDESRLKNMGMADGRGFSVRAIAYLMVGHLIHHQNILQQRLS